MVLQQILKLEDLKSYDTMIEIDANLLQQINKCNIKFNKLIRLALSIVFIC